MSKHKKQHFIPECYLKAWCDPNCPQYQTPYIWSFKKDDRKGKPKAPKNIFHENDMYTIRDENGDRDLKIEHWLSELEGVFTKIRTNRFELMKQIDSDEHTQICIFLSAMHARTRSRLDYFVKEWGRPLRIMDDIAENLKTATDEQKRSMAKSSSVGRSSKTKSLSHDQVRAIVDNPVATVFLPSIKAEASLLKKLDFAILCTDTRPGFITTDRPCLWYDAEALNRPPLYRSPALMYKSIEITFPLSPSQCVLLNRQNVQGYIPINEDKVKKLNRRMRFNASKAFVVNQDFVDEAWFNPGA